MIIDIKMKDLPLDDKLIVPKEDIANKNLLNLKRVKPTVILKDSSTIISKINENSIMEIKEIDRIPLKEDTTEKKSNYSENETKLIEKELKEDLSKTSKLNKGSILDSIFWNTSRLLSSALMEKSEIGKSLRDTKVFDVTTSLTKDIATNSLGLTNYTAIEAFNNAMKSSGLYSTGAKKITKEIIHNFIPGGSLINMGLGLFVNNY